MFEPHRTTEYEGCPQPWEESFYRTGDTHPPKSHRGLISLLLVVIIILGSVVGILGMMNIRLFRRLDMLQEQSTAPMRFDGDSIDASVAEPPVVSGNVAGTPILGLSGYILSSFDQMVYRLPNGFYIVSVSDDSDAAAKGVLPGDLLLQLNGVSVADADTLKTQVQNCQVGESVSLVIFRSGQQYTFFVTVGEAK